MSKPTSVPITTVENYITSKLPGVVPTSAWGEVSYFYNPGHRLKRGTYFATIKQKDGENDKGSGIDREGVWRLNMGISRASFADLFGRPPARPGKGAIIEGPWDFTQLDQITPHPVYGWMSWIAVLSPSEVTWRTCIPLLHDAYERARTLYAKRMR